MADALIQVKTSAGFIFGDATETVTFDNPTQVGSLVVVCIDQSYNIDVTSITDGTNTYAQIRNQAGAPGSTKIWWSIHTGSVTAITVNIFETSDSTSSRVTIAEFSGIDSVGTVDQHNGQSNSAVTTHPSGNITTALSAVLLIGSSQSSTATWTNDASFTGVLAQGNNQICAYRLSAPAGTHSFTPTTNANEDSVVNVASFKVAAVASGRGGIKQIQAGLSHRRVYI